MSTSNGSPIKCPRFVRVLLSTLEQADAGATCVVLPSKDGFAFALALTAALVSVKDKFADLEEDRLTMTLIPGTRVRLAPENRLWEVDRDGVPLYGTRWIRLRNLADESIHHLREDDAFRLTPTGGGGKVPKRSPRITPWELSPLDRLLGVSTGGNVDLFGTQVILVAPQQRTRSVALEVLLSASLHPAVTASELVTWGRIQRNGRTVAKDPSVHPIIAVTHSVGLMAEACRRKSLEGSRVIVDGAKGLARDPQAFDEGAGRHRLLIVADHSELTEVGLLSDRGCEVWAPDPESVLLLSDGTDSIAELFRQTHARLQNSIDLEIEPVTISHPRIEKLHELVEEAWSGEVDEELGKLRGLSWRLLLSAVECIGSPCEPTVAALGEAILELQSAVQSQRMWMPASAANLLERVFRLAGELQRSQQLGLAKGEALAERLEMSSRSAIVARNRLALNQVRSFLDSIDSNAPVFLPSEMSSETYDSVVVTSWLGRDRMLGLVTEYPAREIHVLCYPFEEHWLAAFVRRWTKVRNDLRSPARQIKRITGIAGWPQQKEFSSEREIEMPGGREYHDDPVSSLLRRRKKGRDHGPLHHSQLREARYVGYLGNGYSYLTDSHKIPVVTDLVLDDEFDLPRVPLVAAKELRIGDLVLFRERSDTGLIASMAEMAMGVDNYAAVRDVAELWRTALGSFGWNSERAWRLLRQAGLNRTRATVRAWFFDDERIGPQSKTDLKVIARASQHADLAQRLDDVWNAIGVIRGEHIRAGRRLSDLLRSELPRHLGTVIETPVRIELTLGAAWIVEVEDIGDAVELRPQWEVNRFLSDDEY